MFRVTVKCERIAQRAWPDALEDVRTEFRSRPWHSIVDVKWSGDLLLLVADNDYDSSGEALADEFSDTVSAYAPGTAGYQVDVVSVEVIGDTAMTPRGRFRNRLFLYKLALFATWAVSGVGECYWLAPDKLNPQVREFWFLTYKGETMLAVWLAAFIAYCVAITHFRCPRCHTRLRLVKDLSGLADWARGRDIDKPCPTCGLDFDKEWAPPRVAEDGGAV